MVIADRLESLRGLEERVFDHVRQRATTHEWAAWLRIPMQYSAAAGDQDVTLKLLAAGARGDAMMAACRGGHDTLVDDLLRAGERPDQKDRVTGDAPIHVASSLGHVGVVTSLLREGVEPDTRDATGCGPLHLAAEHGRLPVVRAQLAAGAAVNLMSLDDQVSALMLACRQGHLGIVETLIQHGADVRACPDRHSYTAMHEAAVGNYPECVTALVEAGADMEGTGEHNTWMRTPLQCAAQEGCTEAVSALLRHGAAEDAVNDGPLSQTPLYLAVTANHPGVVNELISAGADVNLTHTGSPGYAVVAADRGHVGILTSLIEGRADVNVAFLHSGKTPLHLAASANRAQAIDVLIEAGADREAKDVQGSTPLHSAAFDLSNEAIVALMRHGCNKEAEDEKGQTPLHVAASRGSCRAVVALLAAGADVAARFGAEERSALVVAASVHSVDVAKALVQYGADVNAATSRGWTALHEATCTNKVKFMHALIGMGAIVDVQDDNGDTPLMLAAGREGCPHSTAVLLLLEHGANVNALNAQGNSPLHWASSMQNMTDVRQAVALLLEWDADETALDADGRTPEGMLEAYHIFEDMVDDNPSLTYMTWSMAMDRARNMFERAPAERGDRRWHRRRLPVLWRARPERFQSSEAAVEGPAGGTRPRVLRSRVIETRGDAAGFGVRYRRADGSSGSLLARIAGLQEEGIFRRIVMLL